MNNSVQNRKYLWIYHVRMWGKIWDEWKTDVYLGGEKTTAPRYGYLLALGKLHSLGLSCSGGGVPLGVVSPPSNMAGRICA